MYCRVYKGVALHIYTPYMPSWHAKEKKSTRRLNILVEKKEHFTYTNHIIMCRRSITLGTPK